MIEKKQLVQKALLFEWSLIVYNVIEAVASVFFGIQADSSSLVGFGLDSTIEVASAAVIVWRFTVHLPEEQEEKVERKALFFIGLTFMTLAAYVGYESVAKLISRQAPETSVPGVIITLLSVIIMPFLALAKRKVARQLGSKAMEADAMETMICAYLSAILLAGLSLNIFFGWWWADPVAGLVMVYFIVKEGREALAGGSCHGKCS